MVNLLAGIDVANFASALLPGIIILWVRYRFLDTKPPEVSKQIPSYAIISVVYNAAAHPFFNVDGGYSVPSWLWHSLQYVIIPLLLAIVIVFVDRSEKFYELATKVGLRPVHHTPTAWDYAFKARPESYALVHLADGSMIAGAWVKGSFSSSTVGDRDLFLSQVCLLADDGSWSIIDPPRSILVCGGAIQMVEFIQGGSDVEE